MAKYQLPPEAKAAISQTLKRYYSDAEARQRMSQARLGQPSRGGHVTNHTRRGISKPESCPFCREEQEASGE